MEPQEVAVWELVLGRAAKGRGQRPLSRPCQAARGQSTGLSAEESCAQPGAAAARTLLWSGLPTGLPSLVGIACGRAV